MEQDAYRLMQKKVERLDSAQITASTHQHPRIVQPVHASHVGLDQSAALVSNECSTEAYQQVK